MEFLTTGSSRRPLFLLDALPDAPKIKHLTKITATSEGIKIKFWVFQTHSLNPRIIKINGFCSWLCVAQYVTFSCNPFILRYQHITNSCDLARNLCLYATDVRINNPKPFDILASHN